VRIKKYQKFTPVIVYWQDIYSNSAWGESETEAQTISVKTCGFYISCKKNKSNKLKELTLAHSLCSDGDSDFTCIPVGVIVDIKEMREI